MCERVTLAFGKADTIGSKNPELAIVHIKTRMPNKRLNARSSCDGKQTNKKGGSERKEQTYRSHRNLRVGYHRNLKYIIK